MARQSRTELWVMNAEGVKGLDTRLVWSLEDMRELITYSRIGLETLKRSGRDNALTFDEKILAEEQLENALRPFLPQ